ncbi:MAG: hypothetical protein DCC67_01415 [Planctomycetota bacterium]|nr:MAG: hypothetical protein DCC67_01415 [Planctomycetota bacterium]
MAFAAVLAIVAKLAIPRLAGGKQDSDDAACMANVGHIEVQAEIWRHDTGAWPASDLSDIGGNINYFPSGLPQCPVTGAPYTIDTSGRVVGHNH